MLIKLVGSDRVVFGTENPGSGTALNPETGRSFDDIKALIDGIVFCEEMSLFLFDPLLEREDRGQLLAGVA